MTVQLLQFLKDWLQTHIKGSDLKYAPHLKDAGGERKRRRLRPIPNMARYFSGNLVGWKSRPRKMCFVWPVASLRSSAARRIS